MNGLYYVAVLVCSPGYHMQNFRFSKRGLFGRELVLDSYKLFRVLSTRKMTGHGPLMTSQNLVAIHQVPEELEQICY